MANLDDNIIVTREFSVSHFCQAEIEFHLLTDCKVSLFLVLELRILLSIIQIPDFVAFFFMSLSLFSVESLQHLILRSLNC